MSKPFRRVKITIERSDAVDEVIYQDEVSEKDELFYEVQGRWRRRIHLRMPE